MNVTARRQVRASKTMGIRRRISLTVERRFFSTAALRDAAAALSNDGGNDV